MRRASLATAAAGLLASVLLSAAAYVYFDTLLLFLFVPFIPFLFRGRSNRPPVRRCPECGFQSRSPDVEYCPRDGTQLVEKSTER
jgi:hypothetical protein